MPHAPTNHDQSDRPAHPWAVAESGSWAEMCESTAFVLRSGGLACHPLSILLGVVAALAASWALPIRLTDLLPWQHGTGFSGTIWAWARLAWLAGATSMVGVVLARTIAARPTRAEVWGVLPPMLVSTGLCVSTYIAVLLGLMLASWLATTAGQWIGGSFGHSIAAGIGLLCLLIAILSTLLLLLSVPSIAANDADAPDAMQRAAAHLLARPGLSLALLVLAVTVSLAVAALAAAMLSWAGRVLLEPLPTAFQFRWFPPSLNLVPSQDDGQAAQPIWLTNTLWLFVVYSLGWAALTQALLTLREVADREDRASCWDPWLQAEAIRQAIEARAIGGQDAQSGQHTPPADESHASAQS